VFSVFNLFFLFVISFPPLSAVMPGDHKGDGSTLDSNTTGMRSAPFALCRCLCLVILCLVLIVVFVFVFVLFIDRPFAVEHSRRDDMAQESPGRWLRV
jgi:hypothetical protein